MNKVLKSWLITLLMFSVFTAVFFFGTRALLNAVHGIKLGSLVKFGTSSSAESQSENSSAASPSVPLGDKEQVLDGSSKSEEKKKGSGFKWSYLTEQHILTTKQTLGIAMLLAMFFAYKFKRNYDREQSLKDIKGEERWMRRRELRKNYKEITPEQAKSAEAVGTPVAHFHGTYYVQTSCVHNLIIGTTGSGKTQTHVLHSIKLIAESADKQNFLINDPKGEILSDTYSILKEQGYKIVVLNLRDTENSSCWNPLTIAVNEYCRCKRENRDLSKVSEFVSTICEVLTYNANADRIWSESSKSLFSALILMFIEMAYKHDTDYSAEIESGTEDAMLPKVTMYSVFQVFSHFGGELTKKQFQDGSSKTLNALDELFQKLPFGSLASAAYTTSKFADGEMRSSIFATAANDFQIFSFDRGISRLTSRSDIDFDALLADEEQPFAIYMIIPDDRPTRYPIASMFVSQAYLSVMEYLEQNKVKTLPRRLNILLDEFANLPKISKMDSKITVSRSRNVQFWLYIQDLAQLETVYKDEAKTIRENCGNLVYIYSGNPDTNDFVSKMLGASTQEYKTSSGKASEEQSQSQQLDSKPLKSANQLRRLKFGETIVISHRQYPILSKFSFYYKLNIPKTVIEDIFVYDPDFTADTNLMPLTPFAELLPVEFAEFKERIRKSESENSTASSGGSSGSGRTEVNPMEDDEEQEQRSETENEAAIDALEAAKSELLMFVEEEPKTEVQIISEINELTDGEFQELLSKGEYTRATTKIRQLDARNELTQEQSVVIQNLLKRLLNDEQTGGRHY